MAPLPTTLVFENVQSFGVLPKTSNVRRHDTMKRKQHIAAAFLLFMVILTLCVSSVALEVPETIFIVQPYLQNVTKDGITIMWETVDGSDSRVDYGLDERYGFVATGTSKQTIKPGTWLKTSLTQWRYEGTYIHKVRLNGLAPETVYHYKATTGATSSEDSTFRTAPYDTTPFKFAVWGDSQRGPEPFETMLNMMVDEGVDFAIGVGDMVQEGDYYPCIHEHHIGPLSRTFRRPWFVVYGNHDGKSDPACRPVPPPREKTMIHDFLSLPNEPDSYSFNYGNSHFICINIYDYEGPFSYVVDWDVGWLEVDLRSPAARNAAFRFAFVHYPPYSITDYDGDPWLRKNVVPLFERYGVDIVFSGHVHEYERGYYNGVYYIITGGGCCADWKGDRTPVGDWDFMKDHIVWECHFVVVEIIGNRLNYRAINDEGNVIDKFVLEGGTDRITSVSPHGKLSTTWGALKANHSKGKL